MNRSPHPVAVVTGLLVASVWLVAEVRGAPAAAAQGPPPAAVAEPAATATPATTEVFVDQVEVRVVNLDVVVIDKDGKRVTGLGRDDFEVREDGRLVEITNFFANDAPLPPPPERRPSGRPQRSSPPAVDPSAATYAVDLEPPTVAPPLVWAFYVDQERLDPGPRTELFRELREFAARAVAPRDFALAASFDGQSLQVLSPLSQGAEAADRALEKAAKQRGLLNQLAARRQALVREISGVSIPEDHLGEAESLLTAIDLLVEEEVQVARRALDALRDLLALLGGVEGRVILVMGGAGYEMRPGEGLYRLWQGRFGENFGAGRGALQLDTRWVDVPREYGRLLRAANSGRFTVYSVQAGATRGPNVHAQDTGEERVFDPFASADPAALGQASTVASLATITGGRTFVSGTDLDESMEAARQDLASYYSLGYRPPRGDDEGYHRVEVKVRRPGLRALHREAVTIQSHDERVAASAVSALLAEGPLDNLYGAIVEAGEARAGKRRGQRLVPVTVKVPLREVVLLPAGAGKHQGKLRFHFALRDERGGFRRLDAKSLRFDVADAQLAEARGKFVSYRVEVELPAGRYRLTTAIEDELGGTSGVAAIAIKLEK